ncbi:MULTISPECIES: AMP-binding protein [unclassified Methanoregula]|uniref:AMP-binding protein n=1 Tax=unclassified Methanoregula TaxID=2649730 RepID=UPI0009CE44EC|nr:MULTISPECIES: AMP-binding protein [unclassified Methanoregula]OPX64930.1 MAG: Acetyl-coenzyme A synthetase [Methanoregula sp. PtaB.Bin085]OPY32982.1 MAG: Acetyl-coenzyme A synthetase [Methanoregula sp. PtaU1.Bin006]
MRSVSDILCLEDLFFHNSNQDPSGTAIESPGYTPLTYRELQDQIRYVVKSLAGQGLSRKDRIAIVTSGGPETGVLIISVMTGFTGATLNPQFRAGEYRQYFRKFRINAVIIRRGDATPAREAAEQEGIPVIEMIPEGVRAGRFSLVPAAPSDKPAVFAGPDDIAILIQTSGTTAAPKIVPLQHRLICTVARRVCATFRFSQTDRCLHIAPYYHTMGIFGNFIAPLCAGGTVICTRDFIAPDIVMYLRQYRPTFYSAGPAVHQAILRELKKCPPGDLKPNSLRFIRSASAALPDRIRDELETILGVPLIETYGMSEVGGAITTNLPPAKRGSVGKPVVPHLAIMDENGIILPQDTEGEIVVKGEVVFQGYDDAADENASVFTNGWFRTGDIGYLDAEGYLYLTGRKKELINKGGEKIAPVEVDDVLSSHPLVKEAMCFKIPDPALGEDIAALVVRNSPDLTELELRAYLLDRIAPFKVPRKIHFVDAVPRNPTGKPLRRAGTEKYSADG